MKNLRLNILILTITIVFLAFGLIGEKTGAQTKSSAKLTPTPKKPAAKTAAKATPKPTAKSPAAASATSKNTPKPTPKTTAKATPKPTPKTAQQKTKELPQVIVSVTSARVRKEADTNAETLELAKLGTIFQIVEQNDKWSKVKFSKDGKDQNGWVSKTVSLPFTNAKRAEIYQTIADKYLKQSALDFTTAAQVFDFLNSSTREIKTQKTLADLSLKRLIALQNALQKVAIDKQTENPYKDFLKATEKEITYSEPSAQWLVRSGNFWELHAKYKTLPIGEEIAWSAAQNPIPGECEGYINCYLYLIRSTDGEYLNFYPNGKYSRQSLKNITNLLEPIAADANEKTIYSSASDTSDRADFNRYLTELRAIIAKTSYIEKSKTLAQIRQIAEAHR
jgi:hypothetical protein